MNYKVGDVVKSKISGFRLKKNYLYKIYRITRQENCIKMKKCFPECTKYKKAAEAFSVEGDNIDLYYNFCEEDFIKATDRERFLYYIHGTKALIGEDGSIK